MPVARRAAFPAAFFVGYLSLCAQAQVSPISIAQNQTVDSMTSDSVTWVDSSGVNLRSAVMAHDNVGVVGACCGQVYGVAMRRYTYQVNGAPRVANVTAYGNGGYGGFGYVVEHSGTGPCVGDDSPLGSFTQYSSYQILFAGRHHTIVRYTQNYPRNCPNQAWTIPVTIDWLFATGKDNPVYAITYDVAGSGAPADTFYDDSRAPYGELNIDGVGALNIDGTAWGDRYKFVTTAASDLDTTSGWDYTGANTVPYVKEWINLKGDGSGDATMGLVQTQTIDQQDAGGARDATFSPNHIDIRSIWTKTSAQANGCNAQVMPCGDDWSYQANGDTIQCCAPNSNARMTWKTQYGFVGATTYPSNNILGGTGATPPGYPKKSYSVYVILGQHTTSPVEAQLHQVENMQNVVLSATTGSVKTSGPAGIADATSVTYAPAGYNHVYGALAFNAASNQLDANINTGAGTLTKPLIIVSSYTGASPAVIFNGTTLAADVDYFASLRSAASELWITLNRNLSGATNHLQINVGGLAAPTGLVATGGGAFVNISWNTVAGATAYELDRTDSINNGWATICPNCGNGYGDVVSSNTAYAYRVRAKNATTMSANSVPDVATTYTFTDSLVAGTTPVKAVHLQDLRNAVDLVRFLAHLNPGVYTDVAASGLAIKGVHITELRSQLDEALAAIGIPTGGYTNSVFVSAVQFQELRDRIQ